MKALKSVFAAVVAASSSLSFAVPKPAGLVDLTSPTGKASSPVSFYKGTAARVFQDNADIVSGGDSVRVIYDKTKSENSVGRFAYTFDEAKVVNAYGIGLMNASTQCNGREPGVWKFYGSNDYDGNKANIGTATWVLLDSREVTDWVRGEYKYFEFDNSTGYTSYMLAIESAQPTASDQYIQFAYLEFFDNDMAEIVNASLRRVLGGDWKAEFTLRKTAPEAVYLDLAAIGEQTVSIPLPSDGVLSEEDLQSVSRTVSYSASFRAVAPSGMALVCELPGKYYFGSYAERTPADYAKTFSVVVSDSVVGAGRNMVIPVRISPSAIRNFSYDDFQQPDYSDLLVTDEYGNALPYEVESWNPAGETLIWIRFPVVAAGSSVSFYFGGPSSGVVPRRAWDSYTGVWHLDEETGGTGTSPDATGHELDVTLRTAADVTGRFGHGRKINTTTGYASNGTSVVPAGRAMSVPSYSSYQLGDTFTVSGWFYHDGGYYYDKLFSRSGGLTFQYNAWNGYQNVLVGGASTTKINAWTGNLDQKKWMKYTLVYSGTTVGVYTNGTIAATVAAGAAVDNDELLCLGGTKAQLDQDATTVYAGTIDEVRLIDETLDAERIRIEYQMESQPEVLVFSPVASTDTASALVVVSSPDGIGSPSPSVGIHEDMAAVEAVPGDPAVRDGVVYDVLKYTVEKSDDKGITWSDPVEYAGRSYSYVPDGRYTRLTWIRTPSAVAVQVASSHPTGSITYSADPVCTIDGTNYYAIGTTVSLTASDPAASSFREWYGAAECVSVDGNVAVVTVGPRPVSLCAVSRHRWVYEGQRLTDGAWVCTASLNKTNVTIKAVTVTPDCGVLDFTDGITDAGGSAEYVLAKFESSAFKENQKLRAVALTPGFLQLGWYTFQSCTNLVTFSPLLPGTMSASSNGQVFDGCSSLTGDVVIASGDLKTFGYRMFAGTKVTSFTAPYFEDLSGGQAFDGCSEITNVVMPSIVNVGTRTFRACTSLRSVTLGESLEILGCEAFTGCTALTTVSPLLPASLKTMLTSEYKGTLNSLAFNGCTSLTGDVKLVNAEMKDVYGQVFQNTAITSLYAPHATNIWKYALNNCSAITNITFGADAVRDADYYPVFGNPKSLEIYFPGKAPILDYASGERSFGNQDYIRVYGDPQMDPDGWGMLLAGESVVMPTVDELARADYPGSRTLGVLTDRNNTRVWLVRYRSPLRKSGMTVIFR